MLSPTPGRPFSPAWFAGGTRQQLVYQSAAAAAAAVVPDVPAQSVTAAGHQPRRPDGGGSGTADRPAVTPPEWPTAYGRELPTGHGTEARNDRMTEILIFNSGAINEIKYCCLLTTKWQHT